MNAAVRGETPGQILRFIVVGGANTVLTAGIFLGLSLVLASTVAYTVAFVVGIAVALVATPRFVFRTHGSVAQRMRYLLWYLLVYLLGLGVVYVLGDRLRLANAIVVLGTLAVTASLSFLGARYLFATPDQAPS